MNKNRLREEIPTYTLRLPGIILLYPIFDAFLGAILLFIMITNQNSSGVIAVGVFFIAPILIVFLFYGIYHITFDKESFVFHSALGKKYHYRYEDIVDIIPGNRYGKIIVQGRNIYVNVKSTHFRYFQEYADKKRGITKDNDIGITTFPKIRETKIYLIAGIIITPFFIFLTYASWVSNQTGARFVSILFVFFALMGIILIICYFNAAIYINEYEIIEIDGLHREWRHDYKDLIAITISGNNGLSGGEILLCFGTKDYDIVEIDSSEQCYKEFKQWLNNRFPDKFVKEETFEEIAFSKDAQKKDIFNGHLLFPGQKILSTVLVIFFCIGCGLLTQFDNVNESNYENRVVVFSEAAYDDNIIRGFELSRLELYSNDSNIPFLIKGFKEYGNQQKLFFQKIQNGDTLHITGYFSSEKSYFFIIQCDDTSGTVFLTQENGIKAQMEDDTHFACIFYAIAGAILILFICYVFLVRNLHKCPAPVIAITLLLGQPSSNLLYKLPPEFLEDDEDDEMTENKKK